MASARRARLWGRTVVIPPAVDADLSRRVAQYLCGVERRIEELPVAPFAADRLPYSTITN